MKKPVFLFLAFVCLFLHNGCEVTDKLEDPTRLSTVELPLLLPSAISQTAYNQQTMSARLAGSYMQYWGNFDSPISFDSYRVPPRMLDLMWDEGFYAGSIKDCQVIIDQAIDEGKPHYEGIAKILLAHELWQTTLMFGDIPMSAALQGVENLTPEFDKQEDVINTTFQLLDEAIALLENEGTPGSPVGDDHIFGGDAKAWQQTAWALKARFHMQMTKRNPQAAQEVLNAIHNGAFSSLADQPEFQWGGSENEAQPLGKFGEYRRNTMSINPKFAEKFLSKDPRRDIYAVKKNNYWWYYDEENPLHWSAFDAAIPLISYVEVAFMEAEALWHTQASVPEIQQALDKAIIASMEQVSIEPTAYEPYVASLSPLADLSREAQLEHIIVEAYKAYYGYAIQITWANYRRTGYPALTPYEWGSSVFNPEGGIPKRHLYPESETLHNPENVAAAKEAQEGALMDVPLWIFNN